MIGKIVTGKSFGGAVAYVLTKEKARLLESDGVDTASVRAITDSFNFQRKARREIAKVVGHISLSFHRDDAPKLSDARMRELAAAYMERMGIADTQYLVARHNDTEHPHLHIIYNRVKYDRTLVSDRHERRRNVRVCKELKQQYGLTFSRGKEHIKTERLHGADKVRQELFEMITRLLPKCDRIADLAAKLKRQGIGVQFVHRGNDPKKAVQGVTFTKGGMTFKGSQIDRRFSYAGLEKLIRGQVEKRTADMAAKELENYLESGGSRPAARCRNRRYPQGRSSRRRSKVGRCRSLCTWYKKKHPARSPGDSRKARRRCSRSSPSRRTRSWSKTAAQLLHPNSGGSCSRTGRCA